MAAKDYRSTRIGIMDAARLLNLRVTELKEAIRMNTPLRGVAPPRPTQLAGGRGTEMLFIAGEVMDCAESLKQLGHRIR